MSIRVLLADDHAVVRDGLAALLDAAQGVEVVGDVADGRAAVMAAAQLKPDVVVMDINMPVLNGIEASREIRRMIPAPQVLILSMHGSSEHVYRALESGALGYLLKESAGSEVVGAVRAVAAGRQYLSACIADIALESSQGTGRKRSPLESLSPRERQLLQLLAEGRSNVDAAEVLSLSIKTVETYRSRLLRKLALGDIAALVRFAQEHGLA